MTMATHSRTRSDYLRAVERSRAETRPQMDAARGGAVQGERAPISVDDVGAAAVRLAARVPSSEVPKRTGSRRATRTTHDAQELALLALVDGTRTVGGIIAVTGETAAKVGARLLRLERLGVIAF